VAIPLGHAGFGESAVNPVACRAIAPNRPDPWGIACAGAIAPNCLDAWPGSLNDLPTAALAEGTICSRHLKRISGGRIERKQT